MFRAAPSGAESCHRPQDRQDGVSFVALGDEVVAHSAVKFGAVVRGFGGVFINGGEAPGVLPDGASEHCAGESGGFFARLRDIGESAVEGEGGVCELRGDLSHGAVVERRTRVILRGAESAEPCAAGVNDEVAAAGGVEGCDELVKRLFFAVFAAVLFDSEAAFDACGQRMRAVGEA